MSMSHQHNIRIDIFPKRHRINNNLLRAGKDKAGMTCKGNLHDYLYAKNRFMSFGKVGEKREQLFLILCVQLFDSHNKALDCGDVSKETVDNQQPAEESQTEEDWAGEDELGNS